MDNQAGIIKPGSKSFVFSRFLPRTMQTPSYIAGDDGDHEAGWNIGQRFLDFTFGGDDVVFDRATGLMWAADGSAAGCNNGNLIAWAAGIAYANGLNFAGFTDWRLPNALELISLFDFELPMAPLIDATHFPHTANNHYWSSTTIATDATKAARVKFDVWYSTAALKTDTINIRCVRGGRLNG